MPQQGFESATKKLRLLEKPTVLLIIKALYKLLVGKSHMIQISDLRHYRILQEYRLLATSEHMSSE